MKIGIIGGGWRSAFFVRIAKQIPEFQNCCVYRSTKEKAEETQHMFGVDAMYDLEAFLNQGFDYVIVSLPRTAVLKELLMLMERGIPVLVETPPGATTEEYNALWEASLRYHTPVLVSEQYFCQPYHSANLNLIQQGRLGRITSVTNGMMHGYHGISMLRKYLNVGIGECEIRGRYLDYPITATCGRPGMVFTGEEKTARRELFQFTFDNGALALWDFSGEQYFSYIRHRHLSIQGTRGEICDYTCRYLTPQNKPVELEYHRLDTGAYSNMEPFTHHGIMLGEEMVFENPFDGFRLNDDEIAIATLMRNMADHVTKGTPLLYPLRDALHDSYLALLMDEANEKGVACATRQSWF